MNKQLLVLSIASIAAVMLLTGTAQQAEAAAFVKLGDIKGESTDDGHKDWINLLSVSQTIDREPRDNGASGSTRHRSSATFGDIVLVKEVDASTPKLQEAIATGEHFRDVHIDFTTEVADKRVPYLQWELKNARITSYSFSGAADNDPIPTDQISLNFEEIKVTYTKYDENGREAGKVEYTWKIEEGTK